MLTSHRADWGKKVARELLSDRPTQYTASGPLSTRRAAHSIHGALPIQCITRIDQSVPYLEKYPYTWMIKKKSHHICFFFKNSWIHQFAWVDTWNKMILAIVTLQGRYSLLDE